MLSPSTALAHGGSAAPAGGAALDQVAIATGAAIVLTGAMLGLVLAHRGGRVAFAGRLAAFAERSSRLPGWSALPAALVTGALLVAVFGMYWDISIHLDDGRDPGPLANPAHYFILFGLFGILFAGVAAMALPRGRPSRAAIRITRDWHAPLGGALIAVCAAFSLSGFPLDDVWHRLFGQDVTLWGPTHLLLIGGAALATLGAWLLFAEGLASRDAEMAARPPRLLRLRQAVFAGSFLVGLSTFQAEFDFAVPQFRLLFHPILLMLAAGVALTAARVQIGRGGALLAVGGFLATRALLTVLVGPVLGHTTPHFPLYLVEAGLVELVALRIDPPRPLPFGAAAGALIGTVGLMAEWGWSHVWATIPWPAALMPEAAPLGLVTAVAAGVLGAFVGSALAAGAPGAASPGPRRHRLAPLAAGLVLLGIVAWALPMSAAPT